MEDNRVLFDPADRYYAAVMNAVERYVQLRTPRPVSSQPVDPGDIKWCTSPTQVLQLNENPTAVGTSMDFQSVLARIQQKDSGP